MILCPEVIDDEAYPAGNKDDDGADDLSYDRDRLLENVDDSQYRQDKTNYVDNR
jgi:hypothetical protein